jgi:heat shock protein HslJ
MACAPALMDQESKVFALLARVQAFELDPTGALLLKVDDKPVLLARRG